MDTQPEIYTPIGMHYHVCESCGEVFTAETTDDPYEDGDDTIPVWCGCDGSSGGREDKMCKDCTELLSDNYYEDQDDGVHFADPGGESALRAETPDNPRNLPCPNCGAEGVLTPEDVALHYCCDVCAQRRELDF
jgi:hypothetical protein